MILGLILQTPIIYQYYPKSCENASCIVPGIYAMMGAASVVAGVILNLILRLLEPLYLSS
jgi:hypothetical protein